jgi:hypothetical protein
MPGAFSVWRLAAPASAGGDRHAASAFGRIEPCPCWHAQPGQDSAQQMQVQRADELGMTHRELVKGAIGQLGLARGGGPGLVAESVQDAGKIAAACRPARSAARVSASATGTGSRCASSTAQARMSAATAYLRGGSETSICLCAREYSLAVLPAPGPVRPDRRANLTSSRPSSASRSRWKAAVALFMPVASAASSRETGWPCAAT